MAEAPYREGVHEALKARPWWRTLLVTSVLRVFSALLACVVGINVFLVFYFVVALSFGATESMAIAGFLGGVGFGLVSAAATIWWCERRIRRLRNRLARLAPPPPE